MIYSFKTVLNAIYQLIMSHAASLNVNIFLLKIVV